MRFPKLKNLFRSKKRPNFAPVANPRKHVRGAAAGPKNGRLVVALCASILLMILLGIFSVRLVRDPSIASKAFGPLFKKTEIKQKGPSAGAGADNHCKPAPVKFYRELMNQEAPAPNQPEQTSSHPTTERVEKPKTAKPTVGPPKPAAHEAAIPEPQTGSKLYTVQVGAFESPSVAQEWAKKWKGRGYDVILKPVARPKAGVIYQLYLGKFENEKKADELVRHLRSKEGITGMRLVLRN